MTKKSTDTPPDDGDDFLTPEVVATPPDDTPEVAAAAEDDVPEFVTWWDPTLTRYVGGRHAADTEPPEGVEVHPYVNTRDLQDWHG